MSELLRRPAILMVVALVASMASAEGVGSAPAGASSDRRLRAATAVRAVKGGLVSLGGPTLRRLPTGGRKWVTLLEVPGDNLYRVTSDETGRLLAAWERDPRIHVFAPDGKELATLPMPAAAPDVQHSQVASFELLPGGRDALVYTRGNVMVTTGQFQGPSASTSAWRVPLDGRSEPRLLFRVDHGHPLLLSSSGAVFAMNGYPGRKCDYGECLAKAIVAWEIDGEEARPRTLLEDIEAKIGRARLIRGGDGRQVALLLDLWTTPRSLGLLRWRFGEAKHDFRTLPVPEREDLGAMLLARDGAIVELRRIGDNMEVWRHGDDGDSLVAALGNLRLVDTALHGLGERADGSLWFHWGDHVGLLAPGKPPRSHDLSPLLPKRSEWAGDIYIDAPEQLWVGIDSRGRDYVRVDFAEVEKRAKPWPAPPAGPPTYYADQGEGAGATPQEVKDGSTDRRVYGVTTIRPYAGGLYTMGGKSLRRLPNGAKRWQELLALPEDNLYRVAADDAGRLLASWEKDPSLHLFSPEGRHVVLPKPASPPELVHAYNVDHLEFLPDGRDALVFVTGTLDSGWRDSSYAAYRIALDGKSEPRLVFRVDHGCMLHASRRGAVFLLPKKPGQECGFRTCWPAEGIVAFELDGDGARRRLLLDGEAVGLSSALTVPGSNDERVGMVLDLEIQRGALRMNGGRALLRWQWGTDAPDYRTIPGHGSFSPVWLLTSTGDFIEAERRSDEEVLEVRRFPPGDGAVDIVALPSKKRMMSGPHGLGERRDGSLWVHWGDRLALLPRGGPPRSFDLEPLFERGTEWAGAARYVPSPESLWIGLDGRGRSYVRVDLADAERRASPWR